MRDGVLRRRLKRLALLLYDADLALHRASRRARGERPWILAGSCGRCARCCEAPAFAVGRLVWSLPVLTRVFLAWQRRVNGFELADRDEGERVFVFRCTHFDPVARSCDSYESRPGMCRDYPRFLLWAANPGFLPGCGYRARPPNADGLDRSLDALQLPPEQRERLRRDLRLDG
jgi:hypothetical protein